MYFAVWCKPVVTVLTLTVQSSLLIGSWHHDYKSGSGEYTYAETGNRWHGVWHHDQRMGAGKLYNKEGVVIAEGIWMNNEGPLTEQQLHVHLSLQHSSSSQISEFIQ